MKILLLLLSSISALAEPPGPVVDPLCELGPAQHDQFLDLVSDLRGRIRGMEYLRDAETSLKQILQEIERFTGRPLEACQQLREEGRATGRPSFDIGADAHPCAYLFSASQLEKSSLAKSEHVANDITAWLRDFRAGTLPWIPRLRAQAQARIEPKEREEALAAVGRVEEFLEHVTYSPELAAEKLRREGEIRELANPMRTSWIGILPVKPGRPRYRIWCGFGNTD